MVSCKGFAFFFCIIYTEKKKYFLTVQDAGLFFILSRNGNKNPETKSTRPSKEASGEEGKPYMFLENFTVGKFRVKWFKAMLSTPLQKLEERSANGIVLFVLASM